MNMIPVSSSNLRSVGYEESSQTLFIQFHNGLYSYAGVPQNIYEGLMNAPSKGKYLHAYIKNSFPYTYRG